MSNSYQERAILLGTIVSGNDNTGWKRLRDFMAPDSGIATVFAYGTYDSSTLTLKYAVDSNGNGAVADATTLTADGKWTITESPDTYVRVEQAGGLGSQSITVKGQ